MQKNYMTYRTAAILSLGISLALFFFFILSLYFREMISSSPGVELPPAGVIVMMVLFGWVTIFLLLFGLFSLNFRILGSGLMQKKKIAAVILASALFAIVFSVAVSLIQSCFVPLRPDHGPGPGPASLGHFLVLGVVRDLFLAVFVVFISQILYLTQKRQQAELNYEAMKTENERSRFEALKNQLDPHFLFNTLNTLDSLIQEDPATARNYLQQLSSVFRYVMPNRDLTTLDEELKFTASYNQLMQLRYEDNLVFAFEIDEKYLNYRIVPMSIQVLVENAIKHNVISSDEPLAVYISVGPDPEVTVSNKIQPKKTPQSGTGIGLSNLAERFRLKLHKEIVISREEGTFAVTLPLDLPENSGE